MTNVDGLATKEVMVRGAGASGTARGGDADPPWPRAEAGASAPTRRTTRTNEIPTSRPRRPTEPAAGPRSIALGTRTGPGAMLWPRAPEITEAPLPPGRSPQDEVEPVTGVGARRGTAASREAPKDLPRWAATGQGPMSRRPGDAERPRPRPR